MKPGSIDQSPWYECSQCCGEVCFPSDMLRVINDSVWCYECYDANHFDGEKQTGSDWHDLPKFVPQHETELAKLREENERLREVMAAAGSVAGCHWLIAQVALAEALGDGGEYLDMLMQWHRRATAEAGEESND